MEMKRIKGTFSGLKFEGEFIGKIAECLQVSVEKPARNLPVHNTVEGYANVLTFHPEDSNVDFIIEEVDTCPACNSRRIKKNQTVNDVHFMKVCSKCNAVFGSCYLGESYKIVLPYMTDKEPSAENLRYYDLECLGSEGIQRRHGWMDIETKLIVQVG